MTVTISSVETEGDEQAAVWVTTVDAVGRHREYRVSLGPGRLCGRWIMGCRQVMDDGGSRPRFPGRVSEAARDHWEEQGYAVFGGADS